MERYKIIVAYNGAAFSGSQRQAGRRTVQGCLETALLKLGWTGRSLILAGRTDTGVHAAGQVAAFDLDWKHNPAALRQALNANLPPDLAVRAVEMAGSGFHPRFDASARLYRYRLFSEPVRDPLREKLAWRVWPEVNGRVVAETAHVFLGSHDFSGYGSPPDENSSTVRTVSLSEWKMADDEWRYQIRADAFLYRMVRRLVFIQVAIARGRCSIETAARVLAKPQWKKELPAGLAPAHGLTLVEVMY